MVSSLRGMNDLFGSDAEKYSYFLDVASSVAKRYGYEFIRTPLLEETGLFLRSVGESSDIVGKEMYRFSDKGGNDVCLRPEGTAGVVRSFIEQKLDRKGGIHRFCYSGTMYRYERPQKGRLREFSQFGCESFGEESVYEDASVILLVAQIFSTLGIAYTLKLNSLGCKECMPSYKDLLVEFVKSHTEAICDDCKRRVDTNPIRVLDCKNESCQAIYKDAPKLLDHLCSGCKNDFAKLKDLLNQSDLGFEIDSHLVRGLDYYTKSAFEFVSSGIGSQNAIAGGGRYDTLVEYLGGKSTPAIGFAIGIERILDLIVPQETKGKLFYIGSLDEDSLDASFAAALQKRASVQTFFEPKPRSLKNHLKTADKIGASHCCVIGSNELADDSIWVKDLLSKEEQTIKIKDFNGLF